MNDTDVVERFTMGAAIVPNLDAIAEFRILAGKSRPSSVDFRV